MTTQANEGPHIARVTWLTVALFVAFALMALTAVTVALFATIDSKQKSEANAERALAQVELARMEAQSANARAENLQSVGECRSGYAQLVDLAVLQDFNAILTAISDVNRTNDPDPRSSLADAQAASQDAVQQRRDSTEVCRLNPASRPDLSKVGG